MNTCCRYIITTLLILYIITSLLLLLSPDRRTSTSDEDKNKSIRSKDAFTQQKALKKDIEKISFSDDEIERIKGAEEGKEELLSHEQEQVQERHTNTISSIDDYPKLTAYIEATNQALWSIKPLPLRQETTAKPSELKKVIYPALNSCYNLPSQYPIDSIDEGHNHKFSDQPPTKLDPFLPWIHDVFPSTNGKLLHFISQNKRRCHTGKHHNDTKRYYQPQVSLFQHIPIKRKLINGQTRYVITDHDNADSDGIETRFICRFKDIINKISYETLSVFPFNYDYTTYRKAYVTAFTEAGFDNHVIWSSQLLFNCPIPDELQLLVKNGKQFLEDITSDYPTLFVDLVPIRTPPRYSISRDFIPPRYGVTPNDITSFNVTEVFGTDDDYHVLPLIEHSGRIENIPICKPSLLTYRTDLFQQIEHEKNLLHVNKEDEDNTQIIPKNHQLIGCTWAANNYKTRKSMSVGDGARRLHEWITFHLLTGFDHIYIYDNTHANDKNQTLEHVTNLFPPSKVTRINWPCKICNNRPLNLDDKGERSSQYAAESSCRLRFGVNAEWLGSMDIDEYLVPLGTHTNIKNLVYDLHNKDGYKIFSFRSWRTRPILSKLETPKLQDCMRNRKCFEPAIPKNTSYLDVFNCEQELPPKKMSNPAEKQIYKTDYVLLHFVHYSTITTDSELSREETEKRSDLQPFRQRFNDKKNHFFNDANEATMMHTKAVPFEHTVSYEENCKKYKSYFGFPWPNGIESTVNVTNDDGFLYTCFINKYVRDYWLPKLHQDLDMPPPEMIQNT